MSSERKKRKLEQAKRELAVWIREEIELGMLSPSDLDNDIAICKSMAMEISDDPEERKDFFLNVCLPGRIEGQTPEEIVEEYGYQKEREELEL
ncbi:MAG: hypothetical protein ACTSYB_02660 [Candidatus Helarchaeota archaeon]